jgi:hypothetical protein
MVGYRPAQMMGLFVRAFCDLPLEAVLIWVFANWTTVLVYETILFAFHVGQKRFWRVLFFRRGVAPAQTRRLPRSV